MAASGNDRLAGGVFAVTLGIVLSCGALAQGATGGSARRSQDIELVAQSSEVDYRSNTVVFHDVVITQGDVRVAAQNASATGLDFENSRWTFSGDVHITMGGDGRLTSNEAMVTFVNNTIARAVINGDPAAFEQRLRESAGLARGRAGTIEYDVASGSVRLSGDAWLTDGRNEIRGQVLVYDIDAQRVQASGRQGEDDRVRIRIRPRPDTEPRSQEPAR